MKLKHKIIKGKVLTSQSRLALIGKKGAPAGMLHMLRTYLPKVS